MTDNTSISVPMIKAHLSTNIEDKYNFMLLESVDSTNTLAKRLAHEGVKTPLVIVADHQSAGRGRLGRSFYSPKTDGLYMSVLIDPKKENLDISTLTPFVATAVADAIDCLCGGRYVGIKWVNDLLVNGKKICGILCESGRSVEGVDFAVIGIGVNLLETDFPTDIRDIAGSVYSCTGKKIDRAELVAKIVENIDRCDKRFMDSYRERSVVVGKRVKVINHKNTYFARAVSILDDGSLSVVDDHGKEERLCYGEISLRLDKNESV